MEHVFPMIDLKATGRRIKELREQRGISVRQLQTFLGFEQPQAIYKWQRGECLPSSDNLYAIACYFHVKVDEILVGNRQDFDIKKGCQLLRVLWNILCVFAPRYFFATKVTTLVCSSRMPCSLGVSYCWL